jgi:outer membrane protein
MTIFSKQSVFPGLGFESMTAVTVIGLVFGCFLSPLQAAPVLPVKGQATPVYTLSDCLELGLQRNPDILKAEQEIKRSQGVVITAKSLLYPKVGLNTRLEERNDDVFSQGTDEKLQRFRDYWTVSLVATQSLYSGGANRQQIAIAKLRNSTALVQLRAVTNQVLRTIRLAVYEMVVQQAQIEAQEKTTALLTEELARQRQYFDAGKSTRFNVLRTQVSLANQKVQLLQAQTQLVSSQIALAKLLSIEWPSQKGQPPPFSVREELACEPMTEALTDLVTLASTRRPELEVLQHQIDIAERQIKVDKATNIPRIDAFAGYEVRRDQNQSSFDSSVEAGSVGLLGTWNIFDGFSGRGLVMSDKATLDSTKISLDTMRLQIRTEVADAYERLKSAEKSLQVQTFNTQTAEDSLKLSQNSAEAGYATLLDVLQATLDLTTARLEAIRSRQRYMNALADLNYAVSLDFQDQLPSGSSSASSSAARP